MFNYYMIAPTPTFSISSLSTQIPNNNIPYGKSSISQEVYSKLSDKFDQLKNKYERVKLENAELKQYVNELEDVFRPESKKRKIKRRSQNQLLKDHNCPYPSCKKQYASGLALNLHIRNKHQGGTKKERIAYIKQILQSQKDGVKLPETQLNISPQLLQAQIRSYKQKLNKQISMSGQNQSEDSLPALPLSDQ